MVKNDSLWLSLLQRMLISGIASYDEGDWHKCISDLETTLEEFWKEERKCRLVCRHSVEWKGVHSDSDIDVILSSESIDSDGVRD